MATPDVLSPAPTLHGGAFQYLEPMPDRRGNLFVVGMDEYQYEHLRDLDPGGSFQFHALLPLSAFRGVRRLSVRGVLREAEAMLAEFPEPVDGILSFVDFPAVEIGALLAQWQGLNGPTPEGVLQCNHKYWSRLLQSEAAPEATPRFTLLDPFDNDGPAKVEERLSYPFWIKPLNGYRSHLAFRVGKREELDRALQRVRGGIGRLAQPLQQVMQLSTVPPEIRQTASSFLMAEELVPGAQCTLEGYVQNGSAEVYGVVDSVQEPERPSCARYEYPSRLPTEVQRRMESVAVRVMEHLDFGDGAFNIEFFHDPTEDRIRILEINPRASQSHAELFLRVDGASNQKVPVELVLGRTPTMPYRQGEYAYAAKFFLREGRDARVVRTPCAGEIRRIEEDVPGSWIELRVSEGDRLQELRDQDSYSYEVAWIWVGGQSRQDLEERYRTIVERMGIELAYDPNPLRSGR